MTHVRGVRELRESKARSRSMALPGRLLLNAAKGAVVSWFAMLCALSPPPPPVIWRVLFKRSLAPLFPSGNHMSNV